MREIIIVILSAAFIIMCILLLFTKNSKNYREAANLPLEGDDNVEDAQQREE